MRFRKTKWQWLLVLPLGLALANFKDAHAETFASLLSSDPTTAVGSNPTVRGQTPPPTSTENQVAFPAPSLNTTIEGINFDENAANNNGLQFIPSDSNGAVGPNHLVSVVFGSIEWHTKDGNQQNSQRLGKNGSVVGSFFEPLTPVNALFNPKVIYDQHAGRFVVLAMEKQDTEAGDSVNTSRILVAVSDDDNPNGDWFFHAIEAKLTFNNSTFGGTTEHWADFPGLAVDEQAIYITANMFTFEFESEIFGGSRLWIISKGAGTGGLYDGGSATVNRYNPAGATATQTIDSTMQPAHVFGITGAPGTTGTFLVRYAGLTDGDNEFLSVIRVDSPLSTPTFTNQFIEVGNIDNTATPMPNAPQFGSNVSIVTNDRRTLNAVWRNNALWVTAQVVPPSGTNASQATAHWWQLDTSNLNTLSLDQQSDVGGEDIANNTHTFYPSITVAGNGNMAIGFSASGHGIFPGAYFTGRLADDPPGQLQASKPLAEGKAFYERTLGEDENRWGDYSGIATDPTDDTTFCVFNAYALEQAATADGFGDKGRWGTRWGCTTMASVIDSRLVNISTRARVQTGDNIVIGGFVIGGSQLKTVLIRGRGPSLPVPNTLDNPTLKLFSGSSVIGENDDWQDTQETEIEATGKQPADPLESAILTTLAPGPYTVHLRGVNGGTGVGIVEILDLTTGASISPLVNISTRAQVQTGDNIVIGGFVIRGDTPQTVLVRGRGPSLPVPGTLSDPRLRLFSGSTVIHENDNWQDTQETEIEATSKQPSEALESAILITLLPGPYTAHLTGVGGGTGVGIIEVLNID